jgi:hypothetical protein
MRRAPTIDATAVALAQIASASTPTEKALARQAGLDALRLVKTPVAAATIRGALRRAGLDK